VKEYKVRSCPFCKGKRCYTYTNEQPYWRVYCRDCGAMGPKCPSEEEAANAWNIRKKENTATQNTLEKKSNTFEHSCEFVKIQLRCQCGCAIELSESIMNGIISFKPNKVEYINNFSCPRCGTHISFEISK
jgi:predicted ArsR family transcriptional regulator